VCLGGGGTVSSNSERGDLPTIVEAFKTCAEEERRLEDDLEGVTPPIPCREFIEAFLRSAGVDDRERSLIELGDRWRGLRGGKFPFGDAIELFLCPSVLPAGEAGAGDAGRAVAEAALIERRLSECERAASLLFVDGGNGAVSLTTLFEVEYAMVNLKL
jgi:hypothetical protein